MKQKSSLPSVQVDVNGHHQEEDGPFSKEIAEFETQVALMLKRMEHLSASIAQSSSSMESEVRNQPTLCIFHLDVGEREKNERENENCTLS